MLATLINLINHKHYLLHSQYLLYLHYRHLLIKVSFLIFNFDFFSLTNKSNLKQINKSSITSKYSFFWKKEVIFSLAKKLTNQRQDKLTKEGGNV